MEPMIFICCTTVPFRRCLLPWPLITIVIRRQENQMKKINLVFRAQHWLDVRFECDTKKNCIQLIKFGTEIRFVCSLHYATSQQQWSISISSIFDPPFSVSCARLPLPFSQRNLLPRRYWRLHSIEAFSLSAFFLFILKKLQTIFIARFLLIKVARMMDSICVLWMAIRKRCSEKVFLHINSTMYIVLYHTYEKRMLYI